MKVFRRLVLALSATAWLALPLAAQTTDAAAIAASMSLKPTELDVAASSIEAVGRDRGKPRPLNMSLHVGKPAPYRAYLLDDPPRLVVEMRGLALPPADSTIDGEDSLTDLRWGPGQAGWSRIVAELPAPYALTHVDMALETGIIDISLEPVKRGAFRPRTDVLTALRGLPEPVATPAPRNGKGPMRVVLDPGHGGFDPGAQVGPLTEASLMLTFAQEVAEALKQRGIEPHLTRQDDSFVPLERRTSIARSVGAKLFISLHADMLPAGQAAGATIYTWDSRSNDRAARELAMRHERTDILAGMNLTGSDDTVAGVLMDMAWTDSQPRSVAFAKHLSSNMALAGIGLHSRPVRGAAFSVLKSPDIPSVLVEVGFLSDPVDRANLSDPAWRDRMAKAFAVAVADWRADMNDRDAARME
ncbi:MAG: N-acetylmuramoyl-L-alanine amidase [Paracoccus denitrificans]|nr:MAG: N-acetylmuramoyl-L-alanine amidase [Paracoccus denitrificans]PZO84178.1 MAG: N-acetylmuramoyl-L-alanine amidase [Paracoccus denitrificans]